MAIPPILSRGHFPDSGFCHTNQALRSFSMMARSGRPAGRRYEIAGMRSAIVCGTLRRLAVR